MDYCGKALECATLDGWAVYRNRSPQYNVSGELLYFVLLTLSGVELLVSQ